MSYFKKYMLLVVALVLVGISLTWFLIPPSRHAETRSPDAIAVDAIRVKQARHDSWMKVHAVVADHFASEVKSPASASVKELKVERDMAVKKGDVLVVLDPQEHERENTYLNAKQIQQMKVIDATKKQIIHQEKLVSQQSIIFDLAQKKFDRYKQLLKEQLVSLQDIEAIKAEALKQENQLVREKSQLIVLKQHLTAEEVLLLDIHNQLQDIKTAIDDSFITAQWDGWVRDIKVRSGSEVMKNEVVMTLQGHHYDLHAPLSIERYKKLSHIKNIAGYINVSGVEHALTQGALVPYKMHKQPEVSWSLPEDKKWIAGERFDVFIRIPHDELTTKLPQKAVFDSYVFEIVEGRLRAVPVTILDVSEQGQSEVLVSGLTENMHIMTTGLAGPKEGLAVKVSE